MSNVGGSHSSHHRENKTLSVLVGVKSEGNCLGLVGKNGGNEPRLYLDFVDICHWSSLAGDTAACPVAALANASEITGLPRDNFELYEISKDEFERLRSQ